MNSSASSNDNENALPLVGSLMLAAAGLVDPYVYRFQDDRWYLSANGAEWMVVEQEDGGLKLVENPF